jgi:hypothetical protein
LKPKTEITRVTLEGHLTQTQLEEKLPKARTTRFHLIVDCLAMKSYDTEARAYFVEWHRKMHPSLAKTAIVLHNRCGACGFGMGLASRFRCGHSRLTWKPALARADQLRVSMQRRSRRDSSSPAGS